VWIFFGGGFDAPSALSPEAGVALFSVGSQGRYVGLFEPRAQPPVRSILLGEDVKLDPAVGEILEGYKEQVREGHFIDSWPRRPAESSFVGQKSCLGCHQAGCEQLQKSAHAHAFESLVKSGDQFDPECVRCHVTGLDVQGGFVSSARTPELENVTCEACHGPGSEHAETQASTPNGTLTQSWCLSCHDLQNSPAFNFERYWPRIAHPLK